MKRIKLTQGKYAIVSDIDYKYLNQWGWWYDGRYALRERRRHNIYMHRIIIERTGLHDFKDSDHIDGNKLNNCRNNLRPTTRSQNMCNCGKHCDNTSGYRGVSWHKKDCKWRARISVNGKQIYLGNFTNKLDAAKAYNDAANKYHKQFARLNPV